ncbi:MAG: TolC family protein, partial [Acidobacteria bacterium]|nr:TolC family protein [Acidobacteriota bacterium]
MMKVKPIVAATVLLACLQFSSPGWAQDVAVPESYVTRMRRQGIVLEMSLREAIRLALANNLEIAIENYNEDLNQEQIIKTRGFYDPTVNFSVGWTSSESPTTSSLQAGGGITVNNFKRFSFDSRLQQNLAGGGILDLNFTNSRNETNSSFSFINPRFNSTFNLAFTQPLLRGFRTTNTTRQIQLFNLDSEITETQFKQQVAEIVQQVQNQYWELVYAVESNETQRRSVELATIQYEDNRKRVEIGVMAPIEITSSRAEIARRELAMTQSEVQIINAQNALKRLLAPDPGASIWNVSVIPTDQPQVEDVQISLQESIRTALEARPELEQIQLQMEKNEIDRSYYRKDGKPILNLRGSFGSNGAAGLVFGSILEDTDGDGIPDTPTGERGPQPDDPRFGNFTKTWTQVFGFDFIDWGISLDVEIPLRNRSNEADLATVMIRERQFLSRLKNQEQMIIVEVRNAYESIATRKKSLETARVASQLSSEQLDGETKRFEAGLSTNFEVLRFQRDLAESQVSELRAMVDYQLAVTALRKALFTIVGESDIILAKAQ